MFRPGERVFYTDEDGDRREGIIPPRNIIPYERNGYTWAWWGINATPERQVPSRLTYTTQKVSLVKPRHVRNLPDWF